MIVFANIHTSVKWFTDDEFATRVPAERTTAHKTDDERSNHAISTQISIVLTAKIAKPRTIL